MGAAMVCFSYTRKVNLLMAPKSRINLFRKLHLGALSLEMGHVVSLSSLLVLNACSERFQ